MRSVVADDEPSARSRLIRLLKSYPDVSVIGEAHDGLAAIEQVETLRPELLFLDIEMPGLSGFEVLRAISPTTPLPLVIFVTGYDQHALAAFEANALAYLLKPVESDRLAQAIGRARRLVQHEPDAESERTHLLKLVHEKPMVLRHVVCRSRDRLKLLLPEEISWFQAEDGIVKARTADESFVVNYGLSELTAALPSDLFFRARREVLVNLAKVKEIRPWFKGGFLLIMS
ncbi:MAG TPA: LytTR family DNA-binding domain-containing protein, partial [Bryobacteraceae bacterium]|nr:LytTR family DNA-binding domain-containing protein [Bryobacteraceae bacterium]